MMKYTNFTIHSVRCKRKFQGICGCAVYMYRKINNPTPALCKRNQTIRWLWFLCSDNNDVCMTWQSVGALSHMSLINVALYHYVLYRKPMLLFSRSSMNCGNNSGWIKALILSLVSPTVGDTPLLSLARAHILFSRWTVDLWHDHKHDV